MKKYCFYFLFFLLISPNIFGKNPQKLVSISMVLKSSSLLNQSFNLPPKTSLSVLFTIDNHNNSIETRIIKLGSVGYATLYEIKNNKPVLLGKSGSRLAIKDRAIIDDISALKFIVNGKESKNLKLVINNYKDEKIELKAQLLDSDEYQKVMNEKKSSFLEKYWKNIFYGFMILALALTVYQILVLPEKSMIYYFFYVLFTLIRASGANESFILENHLPFLQHIGYHSLNSQVFTFVSFIFYLLFIREFTGFSAKKPKLDWVFKLQIWFFVLFIVFDLIFPIEKYIDSFINQFFRAFETIALIMGLFSLYLIIRVYDSFNKYIIIGAYCLVVIAIFGQEIVKRTMDENQNIDLYQSTLIILWSFAYSLEITFFTIALVGRQRIILQTLNAEKEKNQFLIEQIGTTDISNKKNGATNINESFTLATNRGVLVFHQSDIVRLEASGNYTIFSIQNQKQTLGSYTLADFECKLNPLNFLRVHKSHLVNLHYVVKYTKGDGGSLTLQDGSVIPVSRSRKDEVMKRLNHAS